MKTMDEIKPCPCCGRGSDVVGFYRDPFDGYQGDCGQYHIQCAECGLTIKRKTKEQAVEAWNARKA